MKYELQQIDVCLPDFFSGHHLPVIQIPVDENTTYLDLKLAMLDHYQAIDHIEDIDYAAYDEAVHELFSFGDNLEYVPDMFYDIGVFEEDSEPVYIFFCLATIED